MKVSCNMLVGCDSGSSGMSVVVLLWRFAVHENLKAGVVWCDG